MRTGAAVRLLKGSQRVLTAGRLLVAARRSAGQPSEYPWDDFIGCQIEVAAMVEQNSLRAPFVDFSDRRLRRSPLEEERQTHAEEYLPVGMNHPGQPGGRPPWLGNLVQFQVEDGISQDQSFDAMWKKTNSLK